MSTIRARTLRRRPHLPRLTPCPGPLFCMSTCSPLPCSNTSSCCPQPRRLLPHRKDRTPNSSHLLAAVPYCPSPLHPRLLRLPPPPRLTPQCNPTIFRTWGGFSLHCCTQVPLPTRQCPHPLTPHLFSRLDCLPLRLLPPNRLSKAWFRPLPPGAAGPLRPPAPSTAQGT